MQILSQGLIVARNPQIPPAKDMGEIDTKPLESVKAQLSMFGQKSERRRFKSAGVGDEEDKELSFVLKELASYKLQLEIQESANMQALLKIEVSQKTIGDLSAQLKKSEADREKYNKEIEAAKNRIYALEFENKDITTRLSESKKAQEILMFSLNDLRATREPLKEELAATEESNQTALNQVKLMKTSMDIEKQKSEDLLKHVSEINEVTLLSKPAAIEAEKEKGSILLEKEEELHLAAAEAMQAHKQLEENREAKDLENQLFNKSLSFDSLQSELAHVKESYISAVNNLNRLKLEMECMEKDNSERAIFVESMETELKQSKEELLNAREVIDSLKHQIETVAAEMQKTKENMAEIQAKEKEAQVEIALLKYEIHNGKAKTAAAEAAEARSESCKLDLYIAMQQLALETEKAKKETQILKQKVQHVESVLDTENLTAEQEMLMTKEPEKNAAIAYSDSSGFCSSIMILVEEYESLVQKAAKADQDGSHLLGSENAHELESLKKELQAKNTEIRDLKCITDDAVRRANMAENAKAAIEDQLRKWREEKQRTRVALAAFHKESTMRESDPPQIREKSSGYLPLGEILSMKF